MSHTISQNKNVAVALDYYWMPIGEDTPRGVKLQLLTVGGVAIHGQYDGKMTWATHWAPLPKRPEQNATP